MPLTSPAFGSGHGVTLVYSAAVHQFPLSYQKMIQNDLRNAQHRVYALTAAGEEVIRIRVLDRPLEAMNRIDPGDVAPSCKVCVGYREVLALYDHVSWNFP